MTSSYQAEILPRYSGYLPRLRDYAVQLEISRFFEAPTVAEVAHHLEQVLRARP